MKYLIIISLCLVGCYKQTENSIELFIPGEDRKSIEIVTPEPSPTIAEKPIPGEEKEGYLGVFVCDENRIPISDAKVIIHKRGGGIGGVGKTDLNGIVWFHKCCIGSDWITAEPRKRGFGWTMNECCLKETAIHVVEMYKEES